MSTGPHRAAPSSSRTAGSSKRPYVSLACKLCRTRRVKCDGALPCAFCSAKGFDCTYGTDGRKGNTPQQQIDKLKNQVDGLRALLRSHGIDPRRSAASGFDSRDSDSESDLAMIADDGRQSSGIRSSGPAAFINDARSGEAVHYGSSSFHAILAESSQQQPGDSGREPAHDSILGVYGLPPEVITFDTLDSALHSDLLDLYFTYADSYTLFIDREDFRAACAVGARSPIYSRFLHLAILAVGAHLSFKPELRSDPSDPGTAGIGFQLEAMQLIESEIDNPRPTTAVGLAILGTALADRGKEALSWMYGGMAIRAVQHLGLHLTSAAAAGEDTDTRSQVMWSIFLCDKLLCLYTGRACAFRLEDVGINLPVIPLNSASVQLSGSSVRQLERCTHFAFTRLAAVAAQVLKELYCIHTKTAPLSLAAFTRLDDSLSSWAAALPSEMQDGATGIRSQLPCVILLHSTYRCLQILLHRPFWRRFAGPKDQAKLTCLIAARRIAELVSLYDILHGMNRACITFTHNMYTAATTLLLLYVDEDDRSSRTLISAVYEKIIRALTGLSASWSIALSALISVDFLARSCLAADDEGEQARMLSQTAAVVQGAAERSQRPSQGAEELDFEAFLGDDFFQLPAS